MTKLAEKVGSRNSGCTRNGVLVSGRTHYLLGHLGDHRITVCGVLIRTKYAKDVDESHGVTCGRCHLIMATMANDELSAHRYYHVCADTNCQKSGWQHFCAEKGV